jgi:hypothetical protein
MTQGELLLSYLLSSLSTMVLQMVLRVNAGCAEL